MLGWAPIREHLETITDRISESGNTCLLYTSDAADE